MPWGPFRIFFLDYVDGPQPELLLQEAAAVAAVAHVVLIIGNLVGLLNVMRHDGRRTTRWASRTPTRSAGDLFYSFSLERLTHQPDGI